MRQITNISRRKFIGAAAVFAATLPQLAAAGARLSWPIACRDSHLKVTGASDCWAAMKDLGVDGVEAAVGLDMTCPGLYHPSKKYRLDTTESLRELKSDLRTNGRAITAFMMANRFDERPEQELEWVKKLIQAAVELDVRAIRIDLVPHKLPREQFLPFAIEMCRKLCELARGVNVRFGIENHGNTTNDPEFLDELFRAVGSNQLGLTLDTGNFYWYGHPVEEVHRLFAKFASRVVHTHCKSIKYPDDQKNVRRKMGWEYNKYACPINEGDIDFKRVLGVLSQAGYSGDLCVEDESLDKYPAEKRAEILRGEIAWLRRLTGQNAGTR